MSFPRPPLVRALFILAVPFLAPSCGPGEDADARSAPAARAQELPALADDDTPRLERIRSLLGALAADSMEGRAAGTEGELRARDLLVAELERYGVLPAGEDGGYLQRVPLIRVQAATGRTRWTLPTPEMDLDTFPVEARMDAWNVLGLVEGSDPALAHEVVIVGAHYDHVGIGLPNEAGDSIYNGADDDASGTVASLEIARGLVRGEAPGRSVLVALFSAEEIGLLGPRWWLQHPTVEIDRVVADLQIEMIGRPDSLAGGVGGGWLTGYELSTLGDQLAAAGSRIVPDARPEMRFFFRSDNLPFAQRGIPAHTLSSYNLHGEYHTPDDEVEHIDFEHMTALVDAAEAMVRTLASGETPSWHAGSAAVTQLGLRGPFPFACGDSDTEIDTGTALFVEGPPAEVWVDFDRVRRLVPQVEAASGARFEEEGFVFWVRGDEITVGGSGPERRTCALREPAG